MPARSAACVTALGSGDMTSAMWDRRRAAELPRGREAGEQPNAGCVRTGEHLGNHGALGNSAYIHGSWSLGMTSVEEALGRSRSLSLPSFAPSAPRATKTPARAVVAPRVSPTLEHRQLWERRFRMRLRISDTATIVSATG